MRQEGRDTDLSCKRKGFSYRAEETLNTTDMKTNRLLTILSVLAAVAALSSCSGKTHLIREGGYLCQLGASGPDSGEPYQALKFKFDPETDTEGDVNLILYTEMPQADMGTFIFGLITDGSYSLSDGTLTMTYDLENAETDTDFKAKSLLGALGGLGIDLTASQMKDEIARMFFTDGQMILDDVSVSENRITGVDRITGNRMELKYTPDTETGE